MGVGVKLLLLLLFFQVGVYSTAERPFQMD